MNRREALASSLGIPLAGIHTVDREKGSEFTCIVSTEQMLSPKQVNALRRELNTEEERTGCKIILLHSGLKATVMPAGSAKFGYSVTTGNMSISAFADSEEALNRILKDWVGE